MYHVYCYSLLLLLLRCFWETTAVYRLLYASCVYEKNVSLEAKFWLALLFCAVRLNFTVARRSLYNFSEFTHHICAVTFRFAAIQICDKLNVLLNFFLQFIYYVRCSLDFCITFFLNFNVPMHQNSFFFQLSFVHF